MAKFFKKLISFILDPIRHLTKYKMSEKIVNFVQSRPIILYILGAIVAAAGTFLLAFFVIFR
jgi:hypothetical protein